MTTSWIYKYPPQNKAMTKSQLNSLLFQLLGSDELVATWWHTPNKNWNMATPYSVWIRDPESVEKYITFFATKN